MTIIRNTHSAVTTILLCSTAQVKMMCQRKTLQNCKNLGGSLMKILDSAHIDMGAIDYVIGTHESHLTG